MIRDDIKTALVAAMKARDSQTTAAIRLIQAAIKNRDIELRTASSTPDDDLLVTEVLQKMIKQRRESIELYDKGGRKELADAEQQAGVVDLLKYALADQHVLFMKMRNYHWNVTGPQFQPLHALIENQYDQIAAVIDDTAERIRQYGAFAPGTLKEMLELTRLSEEPGFVPTAREMVANLVADHEAIIRQLREDTKAAGDTYGDTSVEDYFIRLVQDHQKMAWLLRAHLEGEGL